jgi:aspartate/glutamate racemase
MGEYTLDKNLYDKAKNDSDANVLLTERKKQQQITDKIFERFGI